MTFRRFGLGLAFAAFLLTAGSGCRSVRTQLTAGAHVAPEWRVLVMPLKEADTGRISDFMLFGQSGARGSSAVVARCVGHQLAAGGFSVVSDDELRKAFWDERQTFGQAAALAPEVADRVARRAGANVLVTGEIQAYQTHWLLFLPVSKVKFRLGARDPASGESLWTSEAARSGFFTSERGLVDKLSARVAYDLRQSIPVAAQPVESIKGQSSAAR